MRRVQTVSKGTDPIPPRVPGDASINRWIAASLASDPPRARSLIVTVWGDALAPHGGALWLSSLIRLLQPFGINERLVRTSVFRLVGDHWLASQAHGRRSRYSLTPGGKATFERAYRLVYAPPSDHWNGEWDVILMGMPRSRGAQRTALRQALHWAGYGTFAPGAFARPWDASDRPAPVDMTLLASAACIRLIARDAHSTATLASSVATAWDLESIAADYRRFLRRFGGVLGTFRAHGMAHASAQQCFIIRTLLIHAFRRVSLRDPHLPPGLLPLDWPGAAAYGLTRDFYRLTHRVAEAHLAAVVGADGEPLPPASEEFLARFGGLN